MARTSTNQRYLDRYSEPCARNLLRTLVTSHAGHDQRRWRHLLVVPLFDEAEFRLDSLLGNLSPNPQLLVILVFNAPKGYDPAAIERTRNAYLEYRRVMRDKRMDSAQICLGKLPTQLNTPDNETSEPTWVLDTLLVDACSKPEFLLTPEQGVGLARKMGNDVALALFELGLIATPWFHQTDADVVLPQDYFGEDWAGVKSPSRTAARLFPFVHKVKDKNTDAAELDARIRLYDAHIRHYVARLEAAGSLYAYSSLGSIMAVHADHYAQVRGFPKRNAGEDFHMLNKLRKTGEIHQVETEPLVIEARWSDRVPFGTGPALRALDTSNFHTYADGGFNCLAGVLRAFERLATAPNSDPSWSPEAKIILEELHFFDFLNRQHPEAAPSVRLKAFHDWFDALKTLRFIHISRRWWPDEPFSS